MKGRIMAEDITINISQNAPVPKCTMPGHAWHDIIHNNEVIYSFIYIPFINKLIQIT